MSARADPTLERLDRILSGPDAIESQTLFRVARPLLALAGWRATIESQAAIALVEALRKPGLRDWDRIAAKLALAETELADNVLMLERVTIVRREAPIAHVLWLRRVVDVLALTRQALDPLTRDDDVVHLALRADPSVVLPPLVPLRMKRATKEEEAEDHRLVDLELATIDHLMTAARAESLMLGRRRRLLIAARQRLLDAAAALPIERRGVGQRARWLAQEITRIDRLEGAGLSTDTSLVHQARQALTRRDGGRLFASLRALEANGDRELSVRASRALRGYDDDREASAERSAEELLGPAARIISDAIAKARTDAETTIAVSDSSSEKAEARDFLESVPADADVAVARAAIAADGFFEVGGALAPVRVVEEARIARVVKHPTRELVVQPAEDVNDLKDAIIGDPRTILLDLAIGRLFARRYVRDEPIRRSRVVLRGEVRVYVLDGSTSMHGTRARVRDAILVAELTTLMQRLQTPRDVRCTLLYRYFDTELGPLHRVETIQDAKDAIRRVVSGHPSGGTDIQLALASSLAQIAEARASDPDLSRAQIVLVTDGKAEVDEVSLLAARSAMAGLPIGISVIAIGEENEALRGLVARQRAKGEAAFYHFIEETDCAAIVAGDIAGRAVHAPDAWMQDPRALEDAIGGLVDELEQLDRERDLEALERLDEEARARREVGLEHEVTAEGDRARVEALRKDRVALQARFARWFPDPAALTARASDAVPLPEPGTSQRDDIDAVVCALASVAEVVALLGGTTLARQADAIELVERLLPDARLTPASYRAVLRNFPAPITSSLRALHAAVVSPGDHPVNR